MAALSLMLAIASAAAASIPAAAGAPAAPQPPPPPASSKIERRAVVERHNVRFTHSGAIDPAATAFNVLTVGEPRLS